MSALAPHAPAAPEAPDLDAVLRLSRFVVGHVGDDGLVLTSPLSGDTLVPRGAAWSVLSRLAAPTRLGDLLDSVPASAHAAVSGILQHATSAGVVVEVGSEADRREVDGSLASWEVADLFFHVSSRGGRLDRPRGGTYRLEGVVPEPPEPGPAAPPAIPLDRPAPGDLDLSLGDALTRRRSIRAYTRALTKEELGAFLHHACAATDVGTHLPHWPYPSGGACYPLDVTVVASDVDGIARGAYRYDPFTHGLTPLPGPDRTDELLRDAQLGAGLRTPPPVLLVISAEFRRVAYKYEALAYRLVVAEVGALYQTLYLVATAMGLAPCALGLGNADRFAEAAGTDFYAHSSVGEFLLGA